MVCICCMYMYLVAHERPTPSLWSSVGWMDRIRAFDFYSILTNDDAGI